MIGLEVFCAFWLVLRISDHKSRTRFFPEMWLLRKVRGQKIRRTFVISYSNKKSTYEWIRVTSKPQKYHFGDFLGFSWPFIKTGSISFLPLERLTSCKKLNKTGEVFPRFFVMNGGKDEQTNKRTSKTKSLDTSASAGVQKEL